MRLVRLSAILPLALNLSFVLFSNALPKASKSRDPALVERSLGTNAVAGNAELMARHEDDDYQQEMGKESMANKTEIDDSPPLSQLPPPTKLQDEHSHHHSHTQPLTVINETQILLTHSPSPPAYYELDHSGGVLITHIFFMVVGFFILLPISIFLKAGTSSLALLPQAGFVICSILGTFFGKIYNSLSPDLYEGDSHSRLGWVVMVLVLALNAWDVVLFALKAKRWFVAKNSYAAVSEAPELESLVEKPEEEEEEERETLVRSPDRLESPINGHPEVSWKDVHSRGPWHTRGTSLSHSDDATVLDTSVVPQPARSLRARLEDYGKFAKDRLQMSLVLFGYVELLSGIAVYSGSCRERFLNGCLAHTIKGSIFFWYGLLTFARFIGAFSALGWSWNKRPISSKKAWSAEFVESLVIFSYGVTNTWLERLGKTGAYSVKDMQHISIAVMFWFAGGLGMLLELQSVRSWLSQAAIIASRRPAATISQPASASFSFNPFPALVIGVTGIAMAAHHQVYQFQVEIHALWGWLLGGFAAFRLLTYFFLYLRPPASILPSRPPTEALASFFLTCGGIMFVLSTEEISFAAMRHEFDDMMAFLNATVAFVCICFTWTLALFTLKGWALIRSTPSIRSHEDPHHHRSVSMSLSDFPDPKPKRINTSA